MGHVHYREHSWGDCVACDVGLYTARGLAYTSVKVQVDCPDCLDWLKNAERFDAK